MVSGWGRRGAVLGGRGFSLVGSAPAECFLGRDRVAFRTQERTASGSHVAFSGPAHPPCRPGICQKVREAHRGWDGDGSSSPCGGTGSVWPWKASRGRAHKVFVFPVGRNPEARAGPAPEGPRYHAGALGAASSLRTKAPAPLESGDVGEYLSDGPHLTGVAAVDRQQVIVSGSEGAWWAKRGALWRHGEQPAPSPWQPRAAAEWRGRGGHGAQAEGADTGGRGAISVLARPWDSRNAPAESRARGPGRSVSSPAGRGKGSRVLQKRQTTQMVQAPGKDLTWVSYLDPHTGLWSRRLDSCLVGKDTAMQRG